MRARTRRLVENLEERILFSLPLGPGTTTPITLNPQNSAVLINIISGPLLTADFNNDGTDDLVFVARGGADASGVHYVGLMLAGRGSGTFTDAAAITAPGNEEISSYAVGDFNGDGFQDIALIYTDPVNGGFNYNVSVNLGHGNGTFTALPPEFVDTTTFVPIGDSVPPASIAVGKFDDFNSNDQMAVVLPTSPSIEAVDMVGIDSAGILGNKGGTTLTGFVGGADQIVSGHFDSDTELDAAVFDPIASQAIIVSGGGADDMSTYDPIALTAPPTRASESVMVAADVNDDGKDDLIVQQSTSNPSLTSDAGDLDVFLSDGNGGGTELPPVSDGYPGTGTTSLGSLRVGTLDSNSDGRVDLATRYQVFRSDPAGHLLATGVSTFTDLESNNTVIGDFDGDSNQDMVAVVGTGHGALNVELKLASSNSPAISLIQIQQGGNLNAIGQITSAQFSANVSVTAGTPTGIVDFIAYNTTSKSITDLGTATLSNSVATITPANVPVGADFIIAAYGGDANYASGNSDDISVNYLGGGGALITSKLVSGIIKSTIPTSNIAGAKIGKSVTIAVKNTGSTVFNDTTTIDLFASADTTIDPSDTRVATIDKKLKIAPGKTTNVMVPVKTLPTGLSGPYSLIGETVEQGTSTSITQTPILVTIGPPVLSLVPFITSQKSKNDGSSIVFVTVIDRGNIPSTGKSQVLLFGSADSTVNNAAKLLDETVSVKLKPGKQAYLKLLVDPLDTQIGRSSNDLVVEVIDQNGNSQTGTNVLD